MPGSDDFDFGFDDDDDSAFLAAATQVEASQNAFDSSPRPAKRRRVLAELSQTNSLSQDEGKATQSQSGDNGLATTKRSIIYEEYDFEDEQETSNTNKSRFKIHVPQEGARFKDQILTQTQGDLDEDMGEFRGAIWKRPQPPKPPPRAPAHLLNGIKKAGMPGPSRLGSGLSRSNSAPGQQSITSLFKKAPRVEDDAALAARLQAEEHDLGLCDHSQYAETPSMPPGTTQTGLFDDMDELRDLPSDAFASSQPDIVTISSQPEQGSMAPPPRPQALRGPQTGLKQMTIFGAPATQDLTASQAAKKKHAWPLKNRDEPPTHHKLDEEAMKTWVYPTNLGSIRDYQFNIVQRSLFHNTLVALPTGLGKTFIAATVMLNYYRWTKDAQIIFMAPTKPLIAQQMEACYGIVGIPRSDTVLMTGETTPTVRCEQWLEKRVFFMTPQTVINDLKKGICDPKKIVLVVVDEAHKATGGYAYTEVIAFTRRFNTSFRVLALTATPGAKVEAVQEVINNLDIARVELRTEESLDIKKYTHEKLTETETFQPSEEQELLMEHVTKVLRPTLEKLNSQNAYWMKDPMSLTAYGLTMARQTWAKSEPGRKATMPVKGMVNAAFTTLSSLAHGIGLLKNHGISPFYSSVLSFQRGVDSGEHKGKSAKAITESQDWVKMMNTMRTWTNNPEFIGHPKLEHLRDVVLNHFLDAGEGRHGPDVPPSATRIIVFASYRDSTDDICRVLKRSEPMIRPHVFVGQSGSAKSGSEGMSQKKQNEVVQDFKSGKYNTLVATSIGEEGLDIGDVDLIVCYDASASPIRMLQRIGRTGRKRVGRVCLLLMKGKEENDYAKAKDNYSFIQRSIADPSKYEYRDEHSFRILPKNVEPVVAKKVIEIPIENSQPIDLNEKGKRANGRGKGKTKLPPKKFFMPDNVRTGFVKASKMGSDDDGEEQPAPKTKKTKAAASKTATTAKKRKVQEILPDFVPVPALQDVLLNPIQQKELDRKYRATADDDRMVLAPDAASNPKGFRHLGPSKYIGHGRFANAVNKVMLSIQNVNNELEEKMQGAFDQSYLDELGPAAHRLVEAQAAADLADEDQFSGDPAPAKPVASKPKAKPRARKTAAPKPDATKPAVPKPAAPKPAAGTEIEAPPPPSPKRKPAPKKRGRKTAASNPYLATEAASSSPPPTQADMRLHLGDIDLGSDDTEGEDLEEDAEPDSELAAFIAHSDDVIETVSSSLPFIEGDATQRSGRGRKKGRLMKRGKKVVDEDEDGDVAMGDIEEEDEVDQEIWSTPPTRRVADRDVEAEGIDDPDGVVAKKVGAGARAKRRVVEEDSEDE